jgi:aldehyde dehydrogenase (NAD+)
MPATQTVKSKGQFGENYVKIKKLLGKLVSRNGEHYKKDMVKFRMIDICDFAVGLSRQLHGLTMHSERPQHRMYEQYHPLVVGLFSAFNLSSCLGLEQALV